MFDEIIVEFWARARSGRGPIAEDLAVAHADRATVRPAQLNRSADESIEYRLQVESRPADDLEHIGGRCLLLQRFLEVARLGLHLVEQTHVFDRDHGLVGEGCDELDLTLRNGIGLARPSANAPIGSPSRISGTPSMARRLPTRASSFSAYSISFQASAISTARCSSATRPISVPRPGAISARPLVVEIGGVDVHRSGGRTIEASAAAENSTSVALHKRKDIALALADLPFRAKVFDLSAKGKAHALFGRAPVPPARIRSQPSPVSPQ